MKNINHRNQSRARAVFAWLLVFVVAAMPLAALAQGTRIVPPKNGYKIQDDVQAGQQAAREAEQQLPLLNDYEVQNYVERIGQRLVSAIPGEFNYPEFRYSFKVVNMREINAFALPGGPMYLNRGMIEAAKSEGEMAGVMAHEISHVALRHGTAQATKAQKYSILGGIGAIAGAVIGGGLGSVVGQGSQTAVGVYFLKFGREYETQADILGAQIMARAGYDPRDLARMFQTIQQQGGGGNPEFLSSHPNPQNRYARINQEAQLLGAGRGTAGNTRDFQNVQARLRGQGRAPSMGEVAQGRQQGGQNYPTGGQRGQVAYPSTRYRQINSQLFRLSVPDNWRDYAGQNSITLAPEGAVGQNAVTHGVILGVDQSQSRNLRQATDQYLNEILQINSYLRPQGGYSRTTVSGRAGLATTLIGRSPITGQAEVVTVVTTLLRDGSIFYMNYVTPQYDQRNYQNAFNQILRSIELND
ncbi:MAG TPA: M48 family metallopeptidase [Pyrinomonadaceae bacterium]|nr:M48 family metallopeptidase [Pyrinomonadaceae bacterium]